MRTDTHNPLHKKCATLEQRNRVERAFSTELNEVKKKTTTMEEELQKVENKFSETHAARRIPSLAMGLTSSNISAKKLRRRSMTFRKN